MFKQPRSSIFRILSSLVTITSGFWIASASQPATDFFQDLYLNHLNKSPILSAFFFLGGCCVLITADLFLKGLDEKSNISIEDKRTSILKELKQKFEYQIKQKLDFDVNFETDFNFKFDLKDLPIDFVTDCLDTSFEAIEIENSDALVEIFTKSIKRLLIIGESGFGKSVLLYKIGLKLISIAEVDASFPIPIILNLSVWEAKPFGKIDPFQTFFGKCLIESLPNFFSSKQEADKFIEDNKCLPILDGLDEVNFDGFITRTQCLHSIYDFVQNTRSTRRGPVGLPEVILSSRKYELFQILEMSPHSMPFSVIVSIEPIANVQKVLENLENNDQTSSSIRLLKILNAEPQLYKIVKTPFNLNTALKLSNLKFDFSRISDENEMLSNYIYLQLQSMERIYSIQKSFKILQFFSKLKSDRFSSANIGDNYFQSSRFYIIKSLFILPMMPSLFQLFEKIIRLDHHSELYVYFWLTFIIVLLSFCLLMGLSSSGERYVKFSSRNICIELVKYFSISFGCILPLLYSHSKLVVLFSLLLFLVFYVQNKSSYRLRFKITSIKLGIIDFLTNLLYILSLSFPVIISFSLTFPNLGKFVRFNFQDVIILIIIFCFFSSPVLNQIINYLLSFKTLPINLSRFLNLSKDNGLLVKENGYYKFRHEKIRQWFRDN